MQAIAIKAQVPQQVNEDFRTYLERSLRDPFTLDLKDRSLMDVIKIAVKAKSKLHPGYRKSVSGLTFNLAALERSYNVTLMPVQISDVFWGHFISFCQSRELKNSTITTMCNQLRSILNWAVKYNATVSPTYNDVRVPATRNQEIALTADEVSRIAYFDVDRFYADKRKAYRETMRRVRDMFVLSCNLFQRHSDMVRIEPYCFDRNMFRITQQKTGTLAVVNIDKYAIDAKTTYRILERYFYKAPYKASIGNYNWHLHQLMKDIGLNETVRVEERRNGVLIVENIQKWQLISSHTARRTAITVNVLRGNNIHGIKKCSGHSDLRVFDNYVRDDN